MSIIDQFHSLGYLHTLKPLFWSAFNPKSGWLGCKSQNAPQVVKASSVTLGLKFHSKPRATSDLPGYPSIHEQFQQKKTIAEKLKKH